MLRFVILTIIYTVIRVELVLGGDEGKVLVGSRYKVYP